MPNFSARSEAQLSTCHPKLVAVLREAIKYFDFTVVEGFRNQEAQHKAYLAGNSKLDWPNGNHNQSPSRAADCYPYPIDYSASPKNLERFLFMHGVFHVIGRQLGIKLRHGIDWDGDLDERNEGAFRDYPHIELAKDEV